MGNRELRVSILQLFLLRFKFQVAGFVLIVMHMNHTSTYLAFELLSI